MTASSISKLLLPGAGAATRSDPEEAAERALVSRVRGGCTEAFRELVECYQHPVHRFCFHYLRDDGEALEACQDTFVRAHGAIGRYQPRARLSTWLFRIALNLCHDRIRRRRPTVPLDDLDFACRGPAPDEAAIRDADLAVVLDTSEPSRIRPLDEKLASVPTVVVDHHPPAASVVGDGGVQDPSAAATAELIYDLISTADGKWSDASVLGVYVALVSDTGSFRFSNTSARAHLIAAEMLARGIDPEDVFRRLFATAPPRRLELLREALGRMGHDPELGIAWMVVPKEITDRLESTPDDYEGLIDHARSIEGTRVSILFREIGEAETKISLRSSGPVDVNRIARRLGGGGHVKAAGATIPMASEEAVTAVLDAVRKDLLEGS